MSEPSAIAAKADPKALVEQIAKALVSDPEEVSVESFDEDGETVLELRVSPQSVGKIIGRSGRTVRAIRALVVGGERETRSSIHAGCDRVEK